MEKIQEMFRIEKETNMQLIDILLNRNMEKDRIIKDLLQKLKSETSSSSDESPSNEMQIVLEQNEILNHQLREFESVNKSLVEKQKKFSDENFRLEKEKEVLEQMLFLLKTEKQMEKDSALAKQLHESSLHKSSNA